MRPSKPYFVKLPEQKNAAKTISYPNLHILQTKSWGSYL